MAANDEEAKELGGREPEPAGHGAQAQIGKPQRGSHLRRPLP
jgi:hypothetical protein